MSAGDRCWILFCAMLVARIASPAAAVPMWLLVVLLLVALGLDIARELGATESGVYPRGERPEDAFRSGAEYFRWHCMEHGQWPDGEKVRAASREWRDE